MRSREYWDDSFEARYLELKKDPTRPPLKVIIKFSHVYIINKTNKSVVLIDNKTKQYKK